MRLPAAEHNDVAWHDGTRRDRVFKGVADYTAGQRQPAFELLDRGRRTVLLVEAKQRAAEHDRENDARIQPLPQDQRNHRCEDENEDERTFELPEKQAQGAQPLRVLEAIRTDEAEAARIAVSDDKPPLPE